jgi:hypothetical protein
MRGISFTLAMAILVAGCAGQDTDGTGPYPIHYEDITKAWVQKTYADPSSVRDIALAPPIRGHIGDKNGWLVCLQTNARSRAGGYEGLKRTALLINNGAVVQATTNAPVCKETSLEPWPGMIGRPPPSS